MPPPKLRDLVGRLYRLALLAKIGLAAAGHWLMAGNPPPRREGPPPPSPAPGGPREPKAEERKPRVDLLGDPLPEGVVARMGSGRMRHPFSFRKMAFSPDGKSIVSGAAGGIRIWDAATGRLRRRFDVDTDWSLSFAFTAEGIAVASAGLEKGTVTVQVVDPASGTDLRRIEMPDRITVCNPTFSADGKQLGYTHEKRPCGCTTRPAVGSCCASP
jgi:hypothetical protein